MIPRVQLGQTGLTVSRLALGANVFPASGGGWYESYYGQKVKAEVAEAERAAIVDAALDLGVNFFLAETPDDVPQVGRIAARNDRRDRMVLMGLLLDWRPERPEAADFVALESELGALLGRLATDRIEIVNIRLGSPDLLTPEFMARTKEVVDRLKAAGRIGAWSFYTSDRGDETMLAGIDSGLFDLAYWNFGFLAPLAARRVLPAAHARGLGFVAFVPFQKGWLFECGAEAGLDPAVVAGAGLRWILAHPGVSAVAVGVADAAQLAANAAAVGRPFDAGDIATLEALTRTGAYGRFVDTVKRDNPAWAFDWRDRQVVGPLTEM